MAQWPRLRPPGVSLLWLMRSARAYQPSVIRPDSVADGYEHPRPLQDGRQTVFVIQDTTRGRCPQDFRLDHDASWCRGRCPRVSRGPGHQPSAVPYPKITAGVRDVEGDIPKG